MLPFTLESLVGKAFQLKFGRKEQWEPGTRVFTKIKNNVIYYNRTTNMFPKPKKYSLLRADIVMLWREDRFRLIDVEEEEIL